MALICSRCRRASPDDALYCHFDGRSLDQQHGQAGPIDIGKQPFFSPFVFPSGLTCANFDQLALACQNHWRDAVEVLRQGFLAGFLGGMGRADLAAASREAAELDDPDRGLDYLLGKLPSQEIKPPTSRQFV